MTAVHRREVVVFVICINGISRRSNLTVDVPTRYETGRPKIPQPNILHYKDPRYINQWSYLLILGTGQRSGLVRVWVLGN